MILTNLLSRLFKRTDKTPPGAVEELLARGRQLQLAGDTQSAERAYREALAHAPDHDDAHHRLGALLGERGELADAALHLDRALASNPRHADALAVRGNLYLIQQQHDRAIANYEQALQLDPANALAHFNLGLAAQATGARERALRHFKRAHELAPEIPDLLKNLTLSYLEFERFEDAESLLREILARAPRQYEANRCLGLVLQKTHRPDEALEYYERVSETGARDPEFLNNFAIVLQDLGRLDEAIQKYNEAIALKPDFPLAIWHRSLAYLLRHEFARAWPDYELRSLSADLPKRAREFPRWTGAPLAGKTLLVYAEQGLGDEIMFSSCIPDVLAAGGRVVIECAPKLESLFRRSFAPAVVYPCNAERTIPAAVLEAGIDLQVPIGSLPLHFRRECADFPAHHGYLKADPTRVARWRERLNTLGPGLKVGIAWQGGTRRSRQPVRSLPLERLRPIIEAPNVRFVELQYVDCAAEVAEFKSRTGICVESWDDVRPDYEETAALVASLDLVISVCTAVIHLGGALGKTVWVMAPYSPEWRYGIASEGMPWYPSVRVFRQPAYAQWDPVIATVAKSLRELEAPACLAN